MTDSMTDARWTGRHYLSKCRASLRCTVIKRRSFSTMSKGQDVRLSGSATDNQETEVNDVKNGCKKVCYTFRVLLTTHNYIITVASLGLVLPGSATEGVTPIFSWKKWRPFLVITVCKVVRTRFCTVLSKFSHNLKFLFHSGVTPLEGVTRGGPSPLVTSLHYHTHTHIHQNISSLSQSSVASNDVVTLLHNSSTVRQLYYVYIRLLLHS